MSRTLALCRRGVGCEHIQTNYECVFNDLVPTFFLVSPVHSWRRGHFTVKIYRKILRKNRHRQRHRLYIMQLIHIAELGAYWKKSSEKQKVDVTSQWKIPKKYQNENCSETRESSERKSFQLNASFLSLVDDKLGVELAARVWESSVVW